MTNADKIIKELGIDGDSGVTIMWKPDSQELPTAISADAAILITLHRKKLQSHIYIHGGFNMLACLEAIQKTIYEIVKDPIHRIGAIGMLKETVSVLMKNNDEEIIDALLDIFSEMGCDD